MYCNYRTQIYKIQMQRLKLLQPEGVVYFFFPKMNRSPLWCVMKPTFKTSQGSSVLPPAPHSVMLSWETPEICDSLSSALFNTHGIRQNEMSTAAEMPTLAEGLVLHRGLCGTYCLCEGLAVLFLMSFQKFLQGTEKNVGHWRKLKSWSSHGKNRSISQKFLRAGLPLGVCTPGSRRTPGTSPRTFQQQSVERQQPVGISSSYSLDPPPPGRTCLGVELVDDKVAEGGFEEVLLGAVFQQGVVHRVGSYLQAANRITIIDSHAESLWRHLSLYLLVDLDGLLVLFKLGTVGSNFQQTLVGRTRDEIELQKENSKSRFLFRYLFI